MWTPPITHVAVGNGLGKNWICGDQIHPARPLKITSRAIVAITTVSTFARSSGRMTTRWMPMPPTKAIAIVVANAHQYEKPWCVIRLQQM